MIAPLSDEVERYLAPQERFEVLRRTALARFGRRLCDLSYANPPATDGRVIAALHAALDRARPGDLQYTPYGGATITRRMVADHLAASSGLAYSFRDVVLTPGAMAALNLALRAVHGGPRREVLIVAPCWLDVPLYAAHLGLVPRLVPVDPASFHLDVAALAAALGPATCAVVLAQPANPTGVVYRDGELRRLGEILAATPAPPLLIADECHRAVLAPGVEFVSPAAHYARTCVVHSFGKALLIQGQRIGYLAVSPRMPERERLCAHLERLCRVMGYATPTGLMQLAVRDLLDIAPATAGLDDKRSAVVAALTAAGYRVVPPEGTFFVYARAPVADDIAFAAALADRGVLVLPSSLFHQPGWFRIALTAGDDTIRAALPVLATLAQEGR